MNNSWIKLFRKMKEWGWYPDVNVRLVFLELLLTVNYEDKEWKGVIIKRGEIVTSYSHLAKEVGIGIHQTRLALDKLKTTNEVAIKNTNKYTVITINKFNEYQEVANKTANKWQTNGKQVATTKEYKNIRNKEKNNYGEQFLLKWNEEFKTKFRAVEPIQANLDYWLKSYSLEEIINAIQGIKLDDYWKDKGVGPEWLLRTKDNNGPIDRIGRMIGNTKKVTVISLN